MQQFTTILERQAAYDKWEAAFKEADKQRHMAMIERTREIRALVKSGDLKVGVVYIIEIEGVKKGLRITEKVKQHPTEIVERFWEIEIMDVG